jgi:small-conductance mechanosensitive channel/ABC-type branched-subunit amino acid transport system substrate-binding protein
MTRLIAYLRGLPKWRLFGLLIAGSVLVSASVSLIIYVTVLDRSNASPVRLVMIAPISGEDQQIGMSMQAGVSQWVADAARRGGPGGHPIDLEVMDEADPDAARKIAADPSVVGVIGPFGQKAAARARAVLEPAGIPVITLGDPGPGTAERPAMFEISPRPLQEMRFLANYVRNVLGERLVSIILPQDAPSKALAESFDEVLQRFGTKIVYRWVAPTDDVAAQAAALKAAADDIAERKVAGSILVLGPQLFSAQAITALRGAEVANRIIGTRLLATTAFRASFQSLWTGHGPADAAMNGMVVTVPVLFDTAGTAAQSFRDNLVSATGQSPDWPAVLAYDAASVLGTAIARDPASLEGKPAVLRERLRTELNGMTTPERAVAALSGPIFFDPTTGASLPELVGTYDGTELVSALTQLSPIREQGVSNFLEELTAGRALYVNDRFMYKTNVVYAGLQLEKVLDINVDTNIAELEFLIWFRWRGTLDPQNVVFPNATAPVLLDRPERESKTGDFSYRAYRARGKFFMNYSNVAHRYGTQTVEVAFRHRVLGRNNLMYVTDILGLGLTGAKAGHEAEGNWLRRLLGTTYDVSPLMQRMADVRVLAGVSGWLMERAWLSQDLGQATSNGDPVFVGFGRPAPVFSTISLGVIVKPDTLDLASVMRRNWLIYAAITALSLTMLAYLLDRRDRGHFWRIQTLLLRVVGWPLLLTAVASITLDFAQDRVSPSGMRVLSDLTSILWWLVPARLLLICVERFVWVPLELSTARKVPTVFRMIVATLVFILAGFGIVAFVLGKTITSLLATSGVLTLIVGLALQSNLKDIISGIMLNLERPFVINDFLMLNKQPLQVVDVSWRTTRLKTAVGSIVALPNGKLSESEIENITTQNKFKVTFNVMLNPNYSPDRVIAALRAAGEAIPIPSKVSEVSATKIEKIGNDFAAIYALEIEVTDFGNVKKVREVALGYIWHALTAAGLSWDAPAGGALDLDDAGSRAVGQSVLA